MTTYYVIEKNYVGPNALQSQYIDANTIVISTAPARDYGGNEWIHGCCGEVNGWVTFAHGEYKTIEAARKAIRELLFGKWRDTDTNGLPFEADDRDVCEVYKPGRYTMWDRECSQEWCYEAINSDIKAQTSDEQMAKMLENFQYAANLEGFKLNEKAVLELMQERRQELRDED